jgi:hypothetical protein
LAGPRTGAGLDLDRPADGARGARGLLLSKRTKQVLETEASGAWNPSNGR